MPRNTIDPVMQAQIADWFTHHDVGSGQATRMDEIRIAARHLAETIAENTPKSADQSAAFRLVREAVHTAVAAIALEPTIS